MSCGKKPQNKIDIISKYKDNKKIEMNLNNFNLLFDPQSAEWRSKVLTFLY